jgi:phosphopantetheine--protein transferase-like protein
VGVWVLDLDADGRQLAADATGGAPRADDGPSRRREQGRSLTRYLAGRFLNVPAERVTLTSDAHGRVSIAPDLRAAEPRAARMDLSVSHSRNVFAAALADGSRVGVDVEVIRDDIDLDAPAQDHFCPAEQGWLRALEPARRLEAFYKCWTAKEALTKAIGQGIGLGLDRIETALEADGSLRVVRVNDSERLARGWSVVHRVIRVGGVSAVVAVVVGQRPAAP